MGVDEEGVMNWAVLEHLIDGNPTASIHFHAPPPAPVMPYENEELRKCLSLCDSDIKAGARFLGLRGKAAVLLYLDTLARLTELQEMGTADLDMHQRTVRLRIKGGEVHIRPFSPRTAQTVWFYLKEREKRAKCAHLFITEEGLPFAPEGLGGWFSQLKRRAGVTSRGRIHRLRHTGALAFLRGTRDPFLLQMLMGHKDLAMSRRYVQGLKQEEAIEAHGNGASPVQSLGLG